MHSQAEVLTEEAQTIAEAQAIAATAEELRLIAEQMTQLVAQETALIEQRDVLGIQPLQENKNRLFQAYTERANALNAQAHLVVLLPVTQRHALRDAVQRFQETSEYNKHVLLAARDSRRFVLNAIREAALTQQAETKAYSAKGHLVAASTGKYRKAGQQATSVAVDSRL